MENHQGRRNWLRKEVVEVKEGSLELRSEEDNGNMPRGMGKGKALAFSQEGEHAGSPVLRVLRVGV